MQRAEPTPNPLEPYEHPHLACDVATFALGTTEQDNYRKLPEKRLEVLLVQRGEEPFAGQWALPGGFVHPRQTVREGALAKLREKTGVTNAYLEQLFTFSDPARDPRAWVVSCAHVALVDKGALAAGALEAGAHWFAATLGLQRESVDHLPEGRVERRTYALNLTCDDAGLAEPMCLQAHVEHTLTTSRQVREERFEALDTGGLAFDHAAQVAYAILRLRNKIEYTDLALNLMPELFTLTELQGAYEAILGRTLLKAAFRRTVAGLVVETDEMTSSAGHRPSRLYRRNWAAQVG